MSSKLQVFTSSRWVRDPDRFDISRGSGGAAAIPFAPSKALLVPALEARTLAKGQDSEHARRIEQAMWAWYAPRYRAEMQISHGAVYQRKTWSELDDLQREAWRNGVRPHPEAWAAELARPRRVYQCWCSLDPRLPATELLARGHCHRVLLAGFLTACGAVYGGELTAAKARAA